ncbi:MAG: hypothetical protein HRU70_02825 [Phycisphaeraceae bacterium]|nr:MAG: hypothetical protein HRU70_02825 [Phycisphaeraceae bacterium]
MAIPLRLLARTMSRSRVIPRKPAFAAMTLAGALVSGCGFNERDEYQYVRSIKFAPVAVAPEDRAPMPLAARPSTERYAALVEPGVLSDAFVGP